MCAGSSMAATCSAARISSASNWDRTDETTPLVIDPVLVFSSYLGGTSVDIGRRIAVTR